MKISTLIKQNLRHYWRTNLAVIFGVATAVAVLAGALLVGDSVRASLKDLFLSRLGNTDYLLSSTTFFREQLADDLTSDERFTASFKDACPIITLNGFVTHEKSGRRASQVQVYGVDERFWQFHGKASRAPADREILLSEALAQELGGAANDAILLRIEKPTAIPEGSLHGRKEDAGRTIRLTMREALAQNSLGEFALRPQQGAVRAVFVSLRRLQKDIEQTGKANAILIQQADAGRQGAQTHTGTQGIAPLQNILKERFALEDLGLRLRILKDQNSIQLESDSAILNDATVEVAQTVGFMSPIMSYLANTMRVGKREIPYSLVTTLNVEEFEVWSHNYGHGTSQRVEALNRALERNPSSEQLPPVLLNDWAARDLNAKLGAVVTLEYYLWQEEGRLETKTAQFKVEGILPIGGIAADRDRVPNYPGISDTESLSAWNPPFPVDLKRVRPKDDAYWKKYRTTAKAFVPLEVGQQLWQTRFGNATSLRTGLRENEDPLAALESIKTKLRDALDPLQSGFVIFAVKAQGVQASQGATDFGEYFFYFSFFLVVSALLLASLFFKLGIEQRWREIGLLEAVGFSAKQIRNLFFMEGAILSSLGSLLGILGAVAFAGLLMYGLKTFWQGAVGTTLLQLRISPWPLVLGVAGGIIAALLCIAWTLRMLKRASPRALLAGSLVGSSPSVVRRKSSAIGKAASPRRRVAAAPHLFSSRLAVIIFGGAGAALWFGALANRLNQTAGFFGAGTTFLIALLYFQSAWLRGNKKRLIQGRGFSAIVLMGFRNATHRAGRSVLCIALIAAAAFIIVAVDAFKRDTAPNALDKKSGTGGFPLMAESLLPLHYNPATVEGREALNLTADKNFSPAAVAFTRFRVRRGEDASCLNLYQPQRPKILGASEAFLNSKRFSFQASLAKTPEEKRNPWLLLNDGNAENSAPVNSQPLADSSNAKPLPSSDSAKPPAASRQPPAAIPVIVDANSLTYVLHLQLGDEFLYARTNAEPLRLRIVAALADSLFQSEFIMSEKNFLQLFKDEGGYGFFLLDVAPEQTATVTAALEERLSDYGFDVTNAGERLASFHRVENTYISTFQTLGAFGLLLGTLGLATVLLRNVLERRQEMALLRAVGYNSNHFALMVVAENLLLLVCGLVTGTACALLAIAPAYLSRGGQLVSLSLGLWLCAVLVTGLCASLLATLAALRSPLLPALRAE
ncbi:MAG: FtsX-like permease family protein [Acidobacteria bacterium]|nr:FtsX-like permease family protein [Acidobacteriota bacterium]